MKWAAGMILLAASSWFLYREYARQALPPPAVVQAVSTPAPVKAQPVLGPEDMAKIRRNARDQNALVRWASMELLYALGDPESIPLLEKAVTDEPDPENRMKALKLLQERAGQARVQSLVKGLKDPETEVRLATLKALEKLGDPAAARWIADSATSDYEPEVKMEAMRVLGTFQDKRRADFENLAARLREQYEAAVERARKEHAEELDKPELQEAPPLPTAPK